VAHCVLSCELAHFAFCRGPAEVCIPVFGARHGEVLVEARKYDKCLSWLFCLPVGDDFSLAFFLAYLLTFSHGRPPARPSNSAVPSSSVCGGPMRRGGARSCVPIVFFFFFVATNLLQYCELHRIRSNMVDVFFSFSSHHRVDLAGAATDGWTHALPHDPEWVGPDRPDLYFSPYVGPPSR
jgi:hypothetical protein